MKRSAPSSELADYVNSDTYERIMGTEKPHLLALAERLKIAAADQLSEHEHGWAILSEEAEAALREAHAEIKQLRLHIEKRAQGNDPLANYLRAEVERLRGLLRDCREDVDYALINSYGAGRTVRIDRLARIDAALQDKPT